VVTVLRYKEGALHYQAVLVTQPKLRTTGRVEAALIIAVWRVTVIMNGTSWKEKVVAGYLSFCCCIWLSELFCCPF